MPNNVKLLVVDDNPMVLAMLQQALTPLALVTTATDAADALLKAVDDIPDLLVCDYQMPGMDGQPTGREAEEPSGDCEFLRSSDGQQGRISPNVFSPGRTPPTTIWRSCVLSQGRHAPHQAPADRSWIGDKKMAKTAPSDGSCAAVCRR